MNRNTTEIVDFALILRHELPGRNDGELKALIAAFISSARALANLAVKQCNDSRFGPMDEKRRERIEGKVDKLTTDLGLQSPIFNRDPRGPAIKLVFPSGRTNDFGAEGICVPEGQ